MRKHSEGKLANLKQTVLRAGALALLAAGMLGTADAAQVVVFQERFETDGEGTRWISIGGGVSEDPASGPAFWGLNYGPQAPSFVGVRAIAPARRAAMAWHHTIPETAISADFLSVFECVANWMNAGRATKTVLFSPPPAGPGDAALVTRLEAAGYTVVNDDTAAPLPAAATIGLVIQSSSGVPDPIRFTSYAAPLLSYNASNHDDELTSSIGTTALTFPGVVQMTTPAHPASCGRTATFEPVSSEQTFDLIGATVPAGATVIANYNLTLAETVTTLARVDQMIAGTLQSAQTTANIASADLAQGAVGQWTGQPGQDNPVPGNPDNTATFGTRSTGKLMVNAAGTYTFAMSVDDGARLRIDLNRNGLDAGDNVLNEEDGTGLRLLPVDVTFPQTGEYDFEWVTLCTGADYGQEICVSNLPGAGTPIDPWDPFTFDLLGASPAAPVALVGEISVTSYVPTGTIQQPQPFIIVFDTGAALLGGPLRGQEGDGFWGGADLNDVDFGTPSNDTVGRFLTLQPFDVRGLENLKLVVALAGSDVDFEANDFLRILVDPDGTGPETFQLLANYTGGTSVGGAALLGAVQDKLGNGTPLNYILRGNFRDVTHPLPAGATDLVIQFEANSTFFNEVFAFDNVRITALGPDAPELSIRRNGANIEVHYTGTLLSSSTVDGAYTPVANAGNPHVIPPGSQGGQRFFRSRNP
jgi:hypothetical protein